MVGEALVTCEDNGQWSGAVPECVCKLYGKNMLKTFFIKLHLQMSIAVHHKTLPRANLRWLPMPHTMAQLLFMNAIQTTSWMAFPDACVAMMAPGAMRHHNA